MIGHEADYRWHVETDVASSMSQEPDRAWCFTDAAGHTHRWKDEEVPTVGASRSCPAWHYLARFLWRLGKRRFVCGCVSRTVCKRCGEGVVPLRREVCLIQIGREAWKGTVHLPTDRLRDGIRPGTPVRLESWFENFEGPAIVESFEAPQARRGGEVFGHQVCVGFVATGTVKCRPPT